ncbi:MAG: tRNA threonylcarbamoyladenosine dehydratase [Treponema sp.]|jgi:tRNA A37 threonylcarbamoyladenosine dehydratase|nr:tRNA threonylcarbamoyladenosine dehydratase [Treponema sp.]
MNEGPSPAFHRLGLLAGEAAVEALGKTRVIVFGLGGVGSWAAEALVRSGIGRLTIVDNDSVCVTNINRQVQALETTIGLPKAAALMKRLLEINPRCDVRAFNRAFTRESAPVFEIEKAAYVIDAIDSLTHKLDLIETAAGPLGKGAPGNAKGLSPVFFSSMGMASRLDPSRIKTADIWKSSGCPLAALVRRGLRKRGFTGHFTVVYSDEPVTRAGAESPCGTEHCFCSRRDTEWCSSKKIINGSVVTVTAPAGMILAGLVIRDVIRRTGAGGEGNRESRGAGFPEHHPGKEAPHG